MNALLMLFGFLFGILLGNFPSIERPRPVWWQVIAIGLVSLTIFLALLPPVAGTFAHVVLMSRAADYPEVPLKGRVDHASKHFDEASNTFRVNLTDFAANPRSFPVVFQGAEPRGLAGADVVIVKTVLGNSHTDFRGLQILHTDPIFTIDFVPALAEKIRNIFFHVPMSWIGSLAYLMTMIFSIMYLRQKDPLLDTKAASAAALGTVFTILATVTGMIWAKANWGAYWNWDPRQTSIFVLLLIYGAYFALRSSVEDEQKRARLSAVYSIFAFVTVPFLVFIIPRMVESLHPGAANDTNSGPLLSAKNDAIDPVILVLYCVSLAAFTLLYFWMLSLTVRANKLSDSHELTIPVNKA